MDDLDGICETMVNALVSNDAKNTRVRVRVRAKVDRLTSRAAGHERSKAHTKWMITRCQFGPVEIVFPENVVRRVILASSQ